MSVRLGERIGRELARGAGLSEAEFEILEALVEAGEEPVRALALRCGLEWEKSRLSHQLRRMERRGLVVREECPEDRRGAVVRVTEVGRSLARRARERYELVVRRYVVEALTEEQLEALGDIAESVLAGLKEKDEV
ncbi:MAG: MarR family transcriptional regulator [Rubrobacteraceae bacterium]|uniref:MarR family winged helix-turn-helix transcriptional regulator n=1 Tax=Rubrobacter naiadicus TaxID=1392641 RepID=UPI002360B60A|nr:MarR family transcriptional regulator [Rubrobacter naiadicus]MBX6762573.1 MarR family transcriptional regulator [Rubrobacteraceae bacterium]MCL6438731.1 MarR family transcriptional regulator [Rubrobacteraceae bacterium]